MNTTRPQLDPASPQQQTQSPELTVKRAIVLTVLALVVPLVFVAFTKAAPIFIRFFSSTQVEIPVITYLAITSIPLRWTLPLLWAVQLLLTGMAARRSRMLRYALAFGVFNLLLGLAAIASLYLPLIGLR